MQSRSLSVHEYNVSVCRVHMDYNELFIDEECLLEVLLCMCIILNLLTLEVSYEAVYKQHVVVPFMF